MIPKFYHSFTSFKRPYDLLAYAHKNQIPVESTAEKPYSIDENCMHTSFEAGLLEDPAVSLDVFKKTNSPHQAPDESADLSIEFKEGIPSAVIHNGITSMDPLNILTLLIALDRFTL